MLTCYQRLHISELARLTVRLSGLKVGTDVVCISESVRVKGLSLESTLSTFRGDSLTNILVSNRTESTISLKQRICLGEFLAYHCAVTNKPHEFPIGSIKTTTTTQEMQHFSCREQIVLHVKVIDNLTGREDQLDLLTEFGDVIALPDELQGQTHLATHHIALQEGT